jgi:hypothetical protein
MVTVDLDDLYGLPLDRFIPERATLARELRSGGEREQAAVVAALRKPSVAAWAVNQLTRTQRREVDRLWAAGDALRDVQTSVLSGSADARDLRSAAEGERAAVDALVDSARGLLSSGGHELSAATVERVAETLHAAALDDGARTQVIEGRLVRELRHVGLGAGLGDPGVGPRPAAKAPKASTAKSPRAPKVSGAERDAVKARREAEAAERRERETAHKQARSVERDAAREVDRARRALRTAQERESRAAEALGQAQAAVQEAQGGVDAAVAAHRQAKAQLDSV